MSFSAKALHKIRRNHSIVEHALDAQRVELIMRIAPTLQAPRAQEYLRNGVCRRLTIIRRCLIQIFEVFPPDRSRLLSWDELHTVEIHLHAFVANLSGIFDNLAWVYVHEHDLESTIGGALRVGLFKKETQKLLPPRLRAYLKSKKMRDWHMRYAKDYRDALAHRIPLYVPPATIDPKDAPLCEKLQDEMFAALYKGYANLAEQKERELAKYQNVAFFFAHSITEKSAKPLLHPQLVIDAMTALAVIRRFRREMFEKPSIPDLTFAMQLRRLLALWWRAVRATSILATAARCGVAALGRCRGGSARA